MNRGRLVVLVVAGAALVVAVFTLRDSAGVVLRPAPAPPPRVEAFAAAGVRVQPVAGPPARPDGAEFVLAGDTPVLRWAPVRAATGYEVRWHPVSSGDEAAPERVRRTVVPAVTLTGVPARSSVSVRVTALDALGRASPPLRLATGALTADPDGTDVTEEAGPAPFVDPFFSAPAPDRYRWRLPESGLSCLVRGRGADLGMLVVRHSCGTVQLRPAVPLRRSAPQDGARGRISVSSDAPEPGGELAVALLPGPHAGLPPGILDRPGPPVGTVGVDPALPAGAVLLRVDAHGPALSAPATRPAVAGPAPLAVPDEPAVQHTWELRIAAGELTVVRDGVVALTAAVTLPWQEATAVVALRPGPDGTGRTLLDAVRMSGPAPPPSAVRVLALATDQHQGAAEIPAASLRGATGVRLLGWLPRPVPGDLTFAGTPVAVRPVGLPAPDGTRAVLADLPVPGPGSAALLPLTGPPLSALRDAVLEVTRRPEPATEAAAPRVPLASPGAAPAPRPGLRVRPGHDGAPAVVTIGLDGLPAQRHAGAPGGYAGMEVLLDGTRIAAIPTAGAAPAVAGNYVLRIDQKLLAHARSLQVRVVPASRDTAPATAAVTLAPS